MTSELPVYQMTDIAERVLTHLRLLDGTTRSAVRILTGATDSEIDALGGLSDD